MMKPEFWNIFHDGYIDSIEGQVPGDVQFSIAAEYLREQFPDRGSAFRMLIKACDMITFKLFHTNSVLSGLDALKGQNLEILSAKLEANILAVITTGGELRIHYDSESVALDSGRQLQLSELTAASNRALSQLRKSER